MDFLSLVCYGGINVAMVLWYLRGKGMYCHFPFWLGCISLGWFFPQALGGFRNVEAFPDGAYSSGLFFATMCTLASWTAYELSLRRPSRRLTWLDARFDLNRLYWAGAGLCTAGFFFQWKLFSLPEEMLQATQWSGAAVKYLFLASIFKFGFLALWLIYISKREKFPVKLMIFIVPSLFLILDSALIGGRRAEMMNVAAYTLICPWFVRRAALPRWVLLLALVFGLILVNSIGLYRAIMKNDEMPLKDRIDTALNADYTEGSKVVVEESGEEFKNYIFSRYIIEKYSQYDFGIRHWNLLVFNYVPGQLLGQAFKKSLMLPYRNRTALIMRREYGHTVLTGTTSTGYADSFASFWWLGFLKFSIIGWIMAVLCRHAMQGQFLGQLLYVYTLGTAMHAVTHGTHAIMLSIWVYFFCLAYPVLNWARFKAVPAPAA